MDHANLKNSKTTCKDVKIARIVKIMCNTKQPVLLRNKKWKGGGKYSLAMHVLFPILCLFSKLSQSHDLTECFISLG